MGRCHIVFGGSPESLVEGVTPLVEDVARAITERGELVLRRTPAGVLELRVNGSYVMDTRETSVERALATRALAQVSTARTVLVGGLGLGFTASAVLEDPRVERLVVAEIEEPLVVWMRDGTVPHGPALLADPRLGIATTDIAVAVERAAASAYDLVLLDVDNGPEQLVYEANAALYEVPFLRAVRRVLAPHGALAIWSAEDSAALRRRLDDVFGSSTSVPCEVDLQGRAERYWLLLAGGRPDQVASTEDDRRR